MQIVRSALILILLSIVAFAQEAAMAVVEKKAGNVAFYSADGKRLSEIKVGVNPHEMAFSPDRKLLYVSVNGVEWMSSTGKGTNTISIIEVASRKQVGVIDLGKHYRPHGVQVLPKTGQLIVTIENPDGLTEIKDETNGVLLLVDPVAKNVLRKFDTKGAHPHMVMLGPKGETAWASNANTGDLAIINLASGSVEKIIPAGKNPQQAVMTKDGKWVFLTNNVSNTISVIDTAKREIVGEIKTGNGPARLFLTPDEKTLVYNLLAGEGVAFADVATRKETALIKLPGQPLSISQSRDGRIAYLGIQDSDKITIVSIPDRKILRTFDTPKGAGPDTVAPL